MTWKRLKDIVATTAANHNNSSKVLGVTPAAGAGADTLFSITSEDLVQKAISSSTTVKNVFNTQMGNAISSDSTLQNTFNTQVGAAISSDSSATPPGVSSIFNTQVGSAIQGDSSVQSIFNSQVSTAIDGDTAIQNSLSNHIVEHNRQITIQQLEAADLDESSLLDPTEAISVDPDAGGGVQIGYDSVNGTCVITNDPPLTLSNFKQMIHPMGGLKINPSYGTPDANGCRSYGYTLSVDTGGSSATEYTLLLGKHPDLDFASANPFGLRGSLHGRDRYDNDGGIGTAGQVFDSAATTTSFVTNLTSATDNIYANRIIDIGGEALLISAYNGTTKAITLSTAMASAPANDAAFTIRNEMRYHFMLDPDVDTSFCCYGYDSTTEAGIGGNISINDNSYKTGNNIYSDDPGPVRPTRPAREFYEYSPVPVRKTNHSLENEVAPWMTARAWTASTRYYHSSLVTNNGRTWIAKRHVPSTEAAPTANNLYWEERNNTRPWDFNRIVKNDAGDKYYICKSPGGGLTDANIFDWFEITSLLDQPTPEVGSNTRSTASIYNRHISPAFAQNGESNVITRPFMSLYGCREYINHHLSNATKVTILVRDPTLVEFYQSDHWKARKQNGVGGMNTPIHSGFALSDNCEFVIYSPIVGQARVIRENLGGTGKDGRAYAQSAGNNNNYFWFTGNAGPRTISFVNFGLNITGLERTVNSQGGCNLFRIDTNTSGNFSGISIDLSGNASDSIDVVLFNLYDSANGFFNTNGTTAGLSRTITYGPNGLMESQPTYRIGSTADGNLSGVINTYSSGDLNLGRKFAIEVEGSQFVSTTLYRFENGSTGVRSFWWGTAQWAGLTPSGNFAGAQVESIACARLHGDFKAFRLALIEGSSQLYQTSSGAVIAETTQNLNTSANIYASTIFLKNKSNYIWNYASSNPDMSLAPDAYNEAMGSALMNHNSRSFWPDAPSQGQFFTITHNMTEPNRDGTEEVRSRTFYWAAATVLKNHADTTVVEVQPGLSLGSIMGGNLVDTITGTVDVSTGSATQELENGTISSELKSEFETSAALAQTVSENIAIPVSSISKLVPDTPIYTNR